jgi:RNA polymerase sigma-70 factor, ECF subfamily
VGDLSVREDVLTSEAREGAPAPARSAGPPEVEAAVVAAARRRDHEAFAAIVACYDARLRSLAFHLLGDRHDLDDALQEVYVHAYRGLPSFRGDAALGTWLHRLTYTTCLNLMRAQSRRPAIADLDAPESPDGGADPAERLARTQDFAGLLASLSLEQRAAVVLVDALDHTYAEAGAIMGIPAGTVASRLAAARGRLRDELAAREVES